jgi:hypothetical protein
MAAALGFAAVAAAPSTSAIPTGPGSLSGVWTPADIDRSVFRPESKNGIVTIEGDPPPLRPEVVAKIEQWRADAKAGHPHAGLQSKCLPSGMPAMMFGSGLPKQTLESKDQITILSEELSFFRIIRLNARHEDDPDPTFMGDSVGHWEGPTLVVDTIGVSDRTELPNNIPHSDQLHIVERYTRTSKDRIEIVMTFDDPKTFTRPWTLVTHLKLEPTRRLSEYYCENNRNVAVGDVTTAVLQSH